MQYIVKNTSRSCNKNIRDIQFHDSIFVKYYIFPYANINERIIHTTLLLMSFSD
jgi:hypothetical protein